MVIAVITLIVIILAFLPIRLIYCKTKKTQVYLKILFFTVKLPSKKQKNNYFNLIKSIMRPLYNALPYLLGGTRLYIDDFIFINVLDLAEKPISVITKIVSTSSILAFITSMAKSVEFKTQRYVVTELSKNQLPSIKIEASFFLYRVIIFISLVAYYKIKATIKKGIKNAG